MAMTRVRRRNSGGSQSQWLANCGNVRNEKKKHESISHKKKGVMRGFEPEKKRSPLSFPTLPSPVENIRPRDQLTSSSTLGDLATQTLSRL